MRIHVIADGKNIRIPLPTGLIFNDLTAYLITRFPPEDAAESLADINAAQLSRFMRELRRAKKYLHDQPLVEVDAADGTHVRIDV